MEPALVDEKLIPWELNKFKLNPLRNGGVIAYYQINKPSDLTATAQLAPKDRPLVCLHLKESENLPKISIMNLRHRNILRVEAVQKLELPFSNQKNIAVVVEPHDGPLTWFLVRLLLTEKGSNAVPSQSLRDVIRQIVEAIEELRINGVYHGNLTIHNIYHSRVGGAIVVKLVNFQNRDIELEAAQLMDWVGLGNILHTISTAAKFRDNTASCSIIDHLASKLMALTSINCLPSIKKGTLDDMLQG
uniref:Protein kinase domain-containing protein n=2 Tax=Triticum urartu TaxID=4572 RepID=A0A8R7U1G9_TRIUA